MSVVNFIPTIWSKKIQDKLEEDCSLVKDCTREYEGDIQYAGAVNILMAGEATVSDYMGTVNYEDMSDSKQTLYCDNRKYFAFLVHDVDEAQSMKGLPERFQEEAGLKLMLEREHAVGALVAGKLVTTKTKEGGKTDTETGATTIFTASDKTGAAIKKAIDDALIKLQENNFRGTPIIELSPRDHFLFKDYLVELKTANDDLIKRGVVGMYSGAEVKVTNNLYKEEPASGNPTSSQHTWAIVRSNKAIAFVGQINSVEAGRLEGKFSDYIRGLDVFGTKIINQDQIVAVKIPRVAKA